MYISVDQAADILRKNGVVAIPTETVYGLAGNGLSRGAVQKIYKAKGRPSNNPLILHFDSLEQTLPFVTEWPEQLLKLVQKFSPGPITFLVPKSNKVPFEVTAGNDRVAVRFPKHELTKELLGKIDFPLAAPSANISGYISPTQPEVVHAQLGNNIDGIVDGGRCKGGIESTIVAWENNRYVLYREGLVTAEMIKIFTNQKVITKSSEKQLVAPGLMKSHYAPNTKTIVSENIKLSIDQNKGEVIGVLTLAEMTSLGVAHQIALSKDGRLEEIASNLYQKMYELDQKECSILIIEKAPDIDVGVALNDRLSRAVAPR
jgi:L-threonylcarbamoyladenylate synthase